MIHPDLGLCTLLVTFRYFSDGSLLNTLEPRLTNTLLKQTPLFNEQFWPVPSSFPVNFMFKGASEGKLHREPERTNRPHSSERKPLEVRFYCMSVLCLDYSYWHWLSFVSLLDLLRDSLNAIISCNQGVWALSSRGLLLGEAMSFIK